MPRRRNKQLSRVTWTTRSSDQRYRTAHSVGHLGSAANSQGVPRTHVENLFVRVTTSRGVVGWGKSFGTARPMVIAAFDHWIRRLAIGQSASDEELVPRMERMLLSLSRSGPLAHALAGLDIALWDIRGKLAGVPVSTLLGGAKRTHVQCYASLLQYYGNPEYLKRNTARALDRGYRQIKLHERTPEAVASRAR